jgi:UDP-glucose 4-epimerase
MKQSKKVLVTGGAGYIGATICSALLDEGLTPVILDDLSSGPKEFTEGRLFYKGDIADRKLLQRIFLEQGPIDTAIHCAAKIIVPESVDQPEVYYRENVAKSIELHSALRDLGCKKIVFSSSAAVYGSADGSMVRESDLVAPSSPYSRSKFMMEQILADFCTAYDMHAISLRYFNPIGADPKLRSGPYAKKPTHILGKLMATYQGAQGFFELTGTQWPTRDGTGIRDYIHVWDLAKAHLQAVVAFDEVFRRLSSQKETAPRNVVINLGTGRGVTVKELLAAFQSAAGKKLQIKEAPARPGDVAGSFASAELAKKLLDWRAGATIEEAIGSALAWAHKTSLR